MRFLAIPNISEGRDHARIASLVRGIEAAHARVLDVHSDEVHHRTVITAAGSPEELVAAMAALAEGCLAMDLREHDGVHPRVGVLDVCPIVPLDAPIEAAVELAHQTGEAIARRAGLPVYFYDDASPRVPQLDLPSIRRGGLATLAKRARASFPPDLGGRAIDPAHGVVCIGARGTLIAFNVFIDANIETARAIASAIRTAAAGNLRTLGLDMGDGTAQVSMNLVAPVELGVDAAFQLVAAQAAKAHANIVATELVGLVPERFQPDPKGKAARLLVKPGRSLEAALRGR